MANDDLQKHWSQELEDLQALRAAVDKFIAARHQCLPPQPSAALLSWFEELERQGKARAQRHQLEGLKTLREAVEMFLLAQRRPMPVQFSTVLQGFLDELRAQELAASPPARITIDITSDGNSARISSQVGGVRSAIYGQISIAELLDGPHLRHHVAELQAELRLGRPVSAQESDQLRAQAVSTINPQETTHAER